MKEPNPLDQEAHVPRPQELRENAISLALCGFGVLTPSAFRLHRPFERQIDPVQQHLGGELCRARTYLGAPSSADHHISASSSASRARKQRWCQLITVSALTPMIAFGIEGKSRYSRTKRVRSRFRSRPRDGDLRLRTSKLR